MVKMRGGALEEKGLPIGNLTSQIFANIFLDKFDWFIKKQLRIKYYFRYADDFVIVSSNLEYLKSIIDPINHFLNIELGLELHSKKTEIRKFRQGIDFLGYIILPYYIVLRTKTKKRMFKKMKHRKRMFKLNFINEESFNQSLQSYLGTLKHCNGYRLKRRLLDIYHNLD